MFRDWILILALAAIAYGTIMTARELHYANVLSTEVVIQTPYGSGHLDGKENR